jgi:hypothetical protein
VFKNQQPYQKANLYAKLCTDAPAFLPPEVPAPPARAHRAGCRCGCWWLLVVGAGVPRRGRS